VSPVSYTPAKRTDWYSVSVDTLQGWGLFLLLVVLAGGGYFGYKYWEATALKRAADEAINDARVLLQQLGESSGVGVTRSEYDTAYQGIGDARRLFDGSSYRSALDKARSTRGYIAGLLAPGLGRGGGVAEFTVVQGRVEYRRGERGDWEPARTRVRLDPGDFVKTSANGSAFIQFADTSTFQVRPNTLFIVSGSQGGGGRNQRTIELQYGWINLNTGQRGSTVVTPLAEARLEDDTAAVVSFDSERERGSFTAFSGSLQVEAGGESRRLDAMQTVAQRGTELSQTRDLPDAPELLRPDQNEDINIDRIKEMVLAWSTVESVASYALQISRNQLFVDNVVDVAGRETARATIGLRGEGTFLWRVAAVNADGLQGPWTPTGRFRVASFRGREEAGDEIPPELSIDDVQPYGSIFIVRGTTEPGASVWINGESVAVEADGTFTKTIQLIQEGWASIEVRAVDAWANESKQRQRVFVEGL